MQENLLRIQVKDQRKKKAGWLACQCTKVRVRRLSACGPLALRGLWCRRCVQPDAGDAGLGEDLSGINDLNLVPVVAVSK